MAKQSNLLLMLIGLVLIVVGAGLAYWGYQLSGSLSSQFTRAVSGAVPDAVMYRYIGGAACVVVGLVLAIRR